MVWVTLRTTLWVKWFPGVFLLLWKSPFLLKDIRALLPSLLKHWQESRYWKCHSISFKKFNYIYSTSLNWILKKYPDLTVFLTATAPVRLQRHICRPISGSSMPGNKWLPALVAAPQAFLLPSHVSRMLICSYSFIGHAGNAGDTSPSMSRVPSWNVFQGVIFSFLPLSLSARGQGSSSTLK